MFNQAIRYIFPYKYPKLAGEQFYSSALQIVGSFTAQITCMLNQVTRYLLSPIEHPSPHHYRLPANFPLVRTALTLKSDLRKRIPFYLLQLCSIFYLLPIKCLRKVFMFVQPFLKQSLISSTRNQVRQYIKQKPHPLRNQRTQGGYNLTERQYIAHI